MLKEVIIYTTPTCVYCKSTKAFFEKYRIAYSEIDVTIDTSKVKEMIEKSGQMGVPVIVIKDEEKETLIVGFDESRMAAALGLTI